MICVLPHLTELPQCFLVPLVSFAVHYRSRGIKKHKARSLVSLPPLSSADHHSICFVPTYSPVVSRTEKVIKQQTPDGYCWECVESRAPWQPLSHTFVRQFLHTFPSMWKIVSPPKKSQYFQKANHDGITEFFREVLNTSKKEHFSLAPYVTEKKEVNWEIE